MPFVKIDPTQADIKISLSSLGLSPGESFTIRLVGHFQPANLPPHNTDTYQFSDVSYAGQKLDLDGGVEITFVMQNDTIDILNLDSPLFDNSDPNGDYGVIISSTQLMHQMDQLKAFLNSDPVPGSAVDTDAANALNQAFRSAAANASLGDIFTGAINLITSDLTNPSVNVYTWRDLAFLEGLRDGLANNTLQDTKSEVKSDILALVTPHHYSGIWATEGWQAATLLVHDHPNLHL